MRRIVLDDPEGPLGAVCEPTSRWPIAAAPSGRSSTCPRPRPQPCAGGCLRAAHERWNWETESARLVALYEELAAERPS